jgi:hypothetical protein
MLRKTGKRHQQYMMYNPVDCTNKKYKRPNKIVLIYAAAL